MKSLIILKLSPLQWLGLVLLIFNFWYSGVLLVSTISYYYEWSVLTLGILTVINYPVAVISIRGVKWILRLKPTQSHKVITIITLAVTIIHIIALNIVPDWYRVAGTGLMIATSWLFIFSMIVILVSHKRLHLT